MQIKREGEKAKKKVDEVQSELTRLHKDSLSALQEVKDQLKQERMMRIRLEAEMANLKEEVVKQEAIIQLSSPTAEAASSSFNGASTSPVNGGRTAHNDSSINAHDHLLRVISTLETDNIDLL